MGLIGHGVARASELIGGYHARPAALALARPHGGQPLLTQRLTHEGSRRAPMHKQALGGLQPSSDMRELDPWARLSTP